MGYRYKLQEHNIDYTSMPTGRYPHGSMRPDTNRGYLTRTTNTHPRHYHSSFLLKRRTTGNITVTRKPFDEFTSYLDDHSSVTTRPTHPTRYQRPHYQGTDEPSLRTLQTSECENPLPSTTTYRDQTQRRSITSCTKYRLGLATPNSASEVLQYT